MTTESRTCECGAPTHEATAPLCLDCAGRAFELLLALSPAGRIAADMDLRAASRRAK